MRERSDGRTHRWTDGTGRGPDGRAGHAWPYTITGRARAVGEGDRERARARGDTDIKPNDIRAHALNPDEVPSARSESEHAHRAAGVLYK